MVAYPPGVDLMLDTLAQPQIDIGWASRAVCVRQYVEARWYVEIDPSPPPARLYRVSRASYVEGRAFRVLGYV